MPRTDLRLSTHASSPLSLCFELPLPSAVAVVTLALCALCIGSAQGQSVINDAPAFSTEPKALLQAASLVPTKKDASVVVLLDSEHEAVDELGREKRVSRTIYRIDAIEGVKQWGAVRWFYAPWYQLRPQVRARVITPDGVQHDLDPKTLSDNVVRDDAPEVYSDEHVYEGPLPAVTVGAVVEEEAVIQDKEPFFEGAWSSQYVFGFQVPVEFTRVIFDIPKSSTVRSAAPLLADVRTQKIEVGEMVRYIYEHGRIDPDEIPDLLPPDSPRQPLVRISTAASWQSIASSYWKRTEPLIRPAEVKHLRAGIRPDDPNAVSRLLAKLHANVRYTGLEFGDSSIIPQAPAVVLERKYGDCKEKSTVLISMLRAIGIRANLALVNSGFGEDIDPEIPTLRRFNHAIVYLPDNDMFIDATAEYFRPGEMPAANQARWALIINDGTTALKRVPQLASSTNRIVEQRDFLLSEYGPAKVVETTSVYGNREASYRSSYEGSESKDLKKNLDSYAQSMYLADTVTKYEYTKADDLSRPFKLRLEINKAKRGSTGLFDAVTAIRLYDMLSQHVPDELTQDEDDKKAGDEAAVAKKSRTSDWYLKEIYQVEWRYRIAPPNGAFRPRVLPENKVVRMGPAVYTQEFTATADGAVDATLRFDLQKRRFSVREAKELRDALRQIRNNGVLYVYFDLSANTLLEQGKVREGLAEFRKLEASHPKEGLHRAQIARAYLASGLGELAREEAQQAVKLDPTSAVCYATLGWVLQHDLFGRHFARGFDPAGAAAAFRKAAQLDPKEVDHKLSLAISLEFNSLGERYGPESNLDEAIQLYREVREDKEADHDAATTNLVYALAYATRFRELRELLGQLGSTTLYDSMRILSSAVLDNTAASLELADQITNNEKARSDALAGAGTIAMRMRLYPQAHELLAAAATGQSNASQMTSLAQVLAHTVKREDMNWDPTPGLTVLKLFVKSVDETQHEQLPNMLSGAAKELPGDAFKKIAKSYRFRFNTELPETVLLDVTLSMVKTTAEGSDATGYRVNLQVPGSKAQHIFVVKENGEYKILAESDQLAPLGQEVLDRIARNDLVGAKTLLDWTREDLQLPGGEDPYAGHTFARAWSRNHEADPSAMRLAAVCLLSSTKGASRPSIADLEGMSKQVTTSADRDRVEEVLMLAYGGSEEWDKAIEINKALLQRNPSSAALLRRLVGTLLRSNKSTEALAITEEYRSRMSDQEVVPALKAGIYMEQNRPSEALVELKSLLEHGNSDRQHVNNYGWAAVMSGTVPAEVLDTVQQATMNPQNRNYAIVHTLASLYAIAGRLPQARQTLLDALKLDKGIDGPESSIWYVMGLLAESYGEPRAAMKLYAKVEPPEVPSKVSSYALSQERLAVLQVSSATAKLSN